jgi:hypothetical protein
VAHIFEDRVLETTTSTGTGNLALNGAVTSFLAFSAKCADTDTFYYAVEAIDAGGAPTGEWETGLGTYASGTNEVVRTTVKRSSNANAAVNFSAGTKRIGMAPITSAVLGLDPTGNPRLPHAVANTLPPLDNVVFSPQRVALGGGAFLRSYDEHGVFRTMQAHIGRNDIGFVVPVGGSNVLTSVGLSTTTHGTLASLLPASTNRTTRSRRINFAAGVTAGVASGWYGTAALFSLGGSGTGGGFYASFRGSVRDNNATAHMFWGMAALSGAPVATTSPATYVNCIGLAQINGGANLNLVYGGSAAQTAINLGSNFPAGTIDTDSYELIIYAPPDSTNTVYTRVERLKADMTSVVDEHVLTAATPGTQLPANSTFLIPRMYRSNNATAAQAQFGVNAFYYEMTLL